MRNHFHRKYYHSNEFCIYFQIWRPRDVTTTSSSGRHFGTFIRRLWYVFRNKSIKYNKSTKSFIKQITIQCFMPPFSEIRLKIIQWKQIRAKGNSWDVFPQFMRKWINWVLRLGGALTRCQLGKYLEEPRDVLPKFDE